MSGSAKYSSVKYGSAAQRDLLDDSTHYPQPPPSYEAQPSSSRDQAALLGGPRSSEDNIPDDFKFGGSVSEATVDIRMQFVRKVYAILTVQLAVTGAVSTVSFFSPNYKDFIQSNTWIMWISLFGALAFLLLTYWKRKSYPTNVIFLAVFTGLEAYAISVIVSFYEQRVVLQAVLLTAGLFAGLTLFACQTKYDFTSWMPYLFGCLWALILVGLVAAFFPESSTWDLVYSGISALIFSAYILVDTQLIMMHHHVEEEIAASISLYLDIINLFLAILRILNSQQGN